MATLKPTVAVMNNGPRKGGAAETFQRLKALPSLKGLFAIHKNVSTGPEVNAAPENVANEAPDTGHGFLRRRRRQGRSRSPITNGRTNADADVRGAVVDGPQSTPRRSPWRHAAGVAREQPRQ